MKVKKGEKMDYEKLERIALIVLSAALAIGAIFLHVRESRAKEGGIEIVRGGIKEELPLKTVDEFLREKRRVNINTASPEELTAIPGVGKATAGLIFEYRKMNGAFVSEKDLVKVKGIGEKKFEKIKPFIKI